MLRFLRKYSSSTGVKILYGVLAALFVIWGVGAVGGERTDVVATVYGAEITRREVDEAKIALERRYEALLRGADLLRALDLRGQALDQLIQQALLQHEAERLGVSVSDDEVVTAITRIPQFQQNGQFRRELLEATLREDGGELEARLRERLLFYRLRSLVTDGVQVSDAEVQERYELDHAKLNLAFAKVAAADVLAKVTLSDADLEQYLTAHADQYRVPTRLRARYIVYKPADVEAQVTPSEGEIAEYYALHKEDRYGEPEQVRARHILVKVVPTADEATKTKAREKAEALRTQVLGGADFATVAKAESQDPGSAAQGGDLGFFARGRMAPQFENTAFALEPGAVSEVVESPFGFHVIKVEEKREAGFKPIEAVRDDIVQTLRHERAFAMVREQAETARRAIVAGKSLAEAAGDHPVAETAPFAVDEPIPGIGQVKAFSDAAFALATGEVSDLVETEEAIYLLSPFERVDAHAPPLADVREKVEADARRERSETLAVERADQILARAKEIGLPAAAAEAGLTVEETGPFDHRTGTIPKMGALPALRTDALALTSEAPLASHSYAAGGDAFVVALKERTPADMSEFETGKDALRDSILEQKKNAAGEAYLDYLKERAQREGALQVRLDVLDHG